MNIFFDVDHTIIDSDDNLRPGVREAFEQLRAAGHSLFLWSGIGKRWEIVERYGLAGLVNGCFEKPLYHYEAMLKPLGIDMRPDYVVDDHPHLVEFFGGCLVGRYLRANAADSEMARVVTEIEKHVAKLRAVPRRGKPLKTD